MKTIKLLRFAPFLSCLFFFYSCNDDDKLSGAADSFGKTSLAVNDIHGTDTPLHDAAKKGDLNAVKDLLEKGADINAKDDESNTPLHLASIYGRTETAKFLIEKGADINAEDSNGHALHLASIYDRIEIVKLLVEKGADINVEDYNGETALHWASIYGHTEIAKFLVMLPIC